MHFANNVFNKKCSPDRAFLRKSALYKEHFRDNRFRNGRGQSETLMAGILAPRRVGLKQIAVDNYSERLTEVIRNETGDIG